jgi:hypothetical protein
VVVGLAETGHGRLRCEDPGDVLHEFAVIHGFREVDALWLARIDIRVKQPHCLGPDEGELAVCDHDRGIGNGAQAPVTLGTTNRCHDQIISFITSDLVISEISILHRDRPVTAGRGAPAG